MRLVSGKRGRWAAVAVIAVVALASLAAGVWARLRRAAPLERGRAAYAQGDWRAAADAAIEQLKQKPGDEPARWLLARASARLERDQAAQSLFLQLGTQHAQAEDFFLLATTLVREDRDDQAILMLERALESDRDHPEALDALGELYLKHDFWLSGRDLALRLSGRPGWQARGQELLGRVHLALYDPAAAARALRLAIELDPQGLGRRPEVRKTLARALLQSARPAEARLALRQLLGAGPDPESAWLLSRAALQEGDLRAAESALAQADAYTDAHPMAAEPAPYIGSAQCARCHAAVFRQHQVSRHTHTFATGEDLLKIPLPAQPVADPHDPKVVHTLSREGGRVRVQCRRDHQLTEALIEYALGSGHRALTLVGRDDAGDSREYRLSLYAGDVGWDTTIHHPDRPAGSHGYLGQLMLVDLVPACLQCHTTDFRAGQDPSRPEAADHGIGCERCHGPGGNHLQAVRLQFADAAILQPQLGSLEQRMEACTQCHKAPRNVPTDTPDFVRFQGPNLVKSRCYLESSGALDCLTCHNPHRNAETAPAFYTGKCLACHAPRAAGRADADASAAAARGVPCPVSPARDCVRCHMPKVPNAVPHAAFTDHHIRIHREMSAGAE